MSVWVDKIAQDAEFEGQARMQLERRILTSRSSASTVCVLQYH